MMNNCKYPTETEQQFMMDLVINEFYCRRQEMDNYNVQELAYRQAISDGAMRLKVQDMYRYIFYTQESVDGARKVHAIKHCKRPRATKVYKYMEYLFHSGKVAVFGYSIESNI